MTYQEFIASHKSRQRYWARNMLGFRHLLKTKPNSCHYSLLELEKQNYFSGIVTQNVDRLHNFAGSHNVIELHGNSYEVKCIKCGDITKREDYQKSLEENNSEFLSHKSKLKNEIRSDGDAVINSGYEDFIIPNCLSCDGLLKPNVVFFGES